MSLPEIGAYAVLRGTQQFIADAFRVERSIAGLNSAVASLGADSVRGFNRASGAVAAFGTAAQVGLAATTVAAASFGVAAKNVAADFEETMTFIGSITQTAGQQLVELGRDIENLSIQGTFGLRKLGEAAAELARSGLAFQEISDGALQATQNFAIAARGELELAEAAEVVATGLQTFNLSANESTRITDSITGVAQRSTATFRDLGVAFRYAASSAAGMQIPVEDLTAVIGVAADAGIRGSRAGTALRQVFTTLVDPPKRAAETIREFNLSIFDAAGNVRPLRDIIIDFERKLGPAAVASGRLTEAQRQNALATIFTQNAYSLMNAILNRGVGEFDSIRQAIEEVSAAEVAAQLLETTNARTKIFQANVEAAANAIGQSLLPAFNQILNVGTQVAENIRLIGLAMQALGGGDATPLFKEFEFLGEDVSSKILPILDLMVAIGQTIDTVIVPAVQNVINAFSQMDLSPIFDSMGSSLQVVVQGFFILATVAATVANNFAQWIAVATSSEEVMTGIGVLANIAGASIVALGVASVATFAMFAAAIAAPVAAIGTIVVGIAGLAGRVKALETELAPVFTNFANNVATIAETVITSFQGLSGSVVDIIGGAFDILGTTVQSGIALIVQLFNDLGVDIQPIISAIGSTFGSIGEVIGEVASAIGSTFRQIVDSVGGFKDSIVEVAGQVSSFLAPAFNIVVGAIQPFIVALGVIIAVNVAVVRAMIELGQGVARLGEDFGRSFDAAQKSVANSLGFIVNIFGVTEQQAQESSEGIATGFENAANTLEEIFSNIGTLLNNFVTGIGNVAAFFGESFGSSFAAAGEVITSLWTELWTNVGTILSNAGTALTELFNNIWSVLYQILGEFIEQSTVGIRFFLSSLGQSFASAGQSLNNIWLSVWNGMIGIVRGAINAMAGMINSFFAGLSSTPLAQFVGGLESAFGSATGAIGDAFDTAGARINEVSAGVNATIGSMQTQITNAANSATSAFGNLTNAANSFSFEMPSVEAGTRRAGGAMRDFEASTEGIPQALGGPGGVGRAARGAAKDIIDLAEAFDIAANKLRQRVEFIAAFGEIGAKAAAALSDAILLRTPANADKAVDSLFEIIDAMREAGIPNFIELGDELIGAFRAAIVDGTEGATSAALELLQQLATEVGIAGRLTVDSFREAFDRATLGAAIGKEADAVMTALNKAFVDGSKKNRDALASAAISYLETLRTNFSPEQAAAYGEQVMEALNQSIEEGTGEFLFGVFDQIAADLSNQGRLTARTFAEAFNQTISFEARGAGGKLIDALVQGIQEGGAKNIRAISDSAFSVIEGFSRNLSPENARDLTDQFMSELVRTIEDGSPEAVAAFARFTEQITQQARELELGETIAEEFRKADDAIEEILKSSAANRHVENLRNALRIEQEILLDIFQTQQEAEAINRRRDQEDEDIDRDRKRRLEDLERDHQKRLEEIRRNARSRQKPLRVLEGGFTKAVSADDELAEERRKHEQRLEDMKTEFERADADRIRKRDREDADREFNKIQETKLREFKETQAAKFDKFERDLEENRIKQRITEIERERDKRIAEAENENTRLEILFSQRLTQLEEKFINPAEEALDSMFDEVIEDLDTFSQKLSELEFTVSVTRRQQESDANQSNANTESGAGFSSSSFQHGGIVPGFGPKLIRAHGGEIVLPTRIALSSARAVQPSINQSTTVNNLTVNANYAQMQSPVQVRHDMQSLIMLAGGR